MRPHSWEGGNSAWSHGWYQPRFHTEAVPGKACSFHFILNSTLAQPSPHENAASKISYARPEVLRTQQTPEGCM